MPIVMQIGMMILMIGNPLLGGAFFLVRLRNKMLYLDHPQKLSIAPRLCWLLVDMGVYLINPTPLHFDNKSVIQIAHNSVFHKPNILK